MNKRRSEVDFTSVWVISIVDSKEKRGVERRDVRFQVIEFKESLDANIPPAHKFRCNHH